MSHARVFFAGLAFLIAGEAGAADTISAAREVELLRLVREGCGTCHGQTLKGGVGPSLVSGALKDKPVETLKFTILEGRKGTKMPPWRGWLTEGEAEWIAHRLVKGLPE